MSDLPILLIGCGDVADWPGVLHLEHGAGLKTLPAPGAVVPPAELDTPFRRQLDQAVADGIRDFVLCGHTDCPTLEALFLGDARGDVAHWLEDAGLSKEAVQDRYPDCHGQGLLDVAVQESLIAQAERLMAYPSVQRAGKVLIELWIVEAVTGEVHVFNPASGQFEAAGPRRTGCEPPAPPGQEPRTFHVFDPSLASS